MNAEIQHTPENHNVSFFMPATKVQNGAGAGAKLGNHRTGKDSIGAPGDFEKMHLPGDKEQQKMVDGGKSGEPKAQAPRPQYRRDSVSSLGLRAYRDENGKLLPELKTEGFVDSLEPAPQAPSVENKENQPPSNQGPRRARSGGVLKPRAQQAPKGTAQQDLKAAFQKLEQMPKGKLARLGQKTKYQKMAQASLQRACDSPGTAASEKCASYYGAIADIDKFLKATPNSTKRNALEQARSALVKLTAESYLEPLSVKGSTPQDLKESIEGLTKLLSSPDSHSETLFLVSDNIESNRFIESIREVTEKDSTIDPTGQNLIRALHTSSEGKVVAESLVGKVMDMDMPEQALSNFFRGSEATPRLLFAHLDSILGTDTKALLNTFYADNKARLSVPLEVQVSKANAPENDDQLNERSEELSKLAGSLLDASSTLLETILTQKGEKGKLLRSILSKYATDAQTHFRAKHREPLQGADIQKYQSDGSEFGSTLATNFVFLRCINPLLAQGQFLDNTAQLNPVQSQNLKLVSTVAQKTVNVAPGRDNLQFAAQTLIDGGAARRTLDRMKVLSKVDPNVQTDFQLRN